MTDQRNHEITTVVGPELETQIEPSHRLRTIAAKSVIVACGALGAAASMISQQPSAERTIGPVSIDAEVAYSPTIQVLGLTAAESRYGIGMDIDIKAPDLDEIPDISRRLAPIAQTVASNKNESTVLELIQEEYTPEINGMKNELIAESLLYLGVGALAGSFLSAKLLEKLGNNRQSWKFVLASTVVGVLAVGAAEFQSLGNVNSDNSAERLSQELRQPFDKYLMTSTSNMLVNLDSINEETRKQIERFVGITNSLSRFQPAIDADSQVWLVYSDSHVSPTAAETIETIAQAANADAITGLGDYGNTGNDLEMDVLDGLAMDQTYFIGFNDIRTCKTWDELSDICKERGELLPHGAVSGNHDPEKIVALFDQLGMTNLNEATSFNGISIVSLADACFVDSVGCRGDAVETINRDYANNQLIQLKASGSPMPKIGFFASYDAADVFIGEIDTLIVGGKHEFSHITKDGSEIYYVPTVGQAFPRGAKEAGALILTVKSDGALLQCSNVSWQTLKTKTPSISSCET